MTNFLNKRWHPLIILALIIFLASSNPNPLFGLETTLQNTTLLGIRLDQSIGLLAQVLLYLVLTFFLARALSWQKEPGSALLLMVFLTALVFALANEFYQIVIPGRDFDLRDLLMAGWGALLGLFGYVIWHSPWHRDQSEQDLLL